MRGHKYLVKKPLRCGCGLSVSLEPGYMNSRNPNVFYLMSDEQLEEIEDGTDREDVKSDALQVVRCPGCDRLMVSQDAKHEKFDNYAREE